MASFRSAFEEALDFVKGKASDFTSSVRRTTKNLFDDFEDDYKNYVQQQQAQRQRQQQANNQLVKKVLEMPSRATNKVKPIFDYFKQPEVISSSGEMTPSFWSNRTAQNLDRGVRELPKTLRTSGQSAKSNLYLAGGMGLDLLDRAAPRLKLKPEGAMFESTLKYANDPNLPEWQRKMAQDQLGMYEGYEQIAEENNKVRHLSDEWLRRGLEEQEVANEMMAELDPIEGDTTIEQMKDPRWWSRLTVMTVPNVISSYLPALAATIATKNPQFIAAVTLGTGYVQGAGEMYGTSRELGLDDNQSKDMARLYGMVSAVLEKVGIDQALDVLPGGDRVKSKIVKSTMREILEVGLTEAPTETLQQLTQNVMLREEFPEYPLAEGLIESAVGGFIGGSVAGAGTVGISNLTLPNNKPQGTVAGYEGLSKRESFQTVGAGIQEDLREYMEAPETPGVDTTITLSKDEDGNPVLERRSYDMATGKQEVIQKPIPYLYKALSQADLRAIIDDGYVPVERATFRHTDPSLLLPNEGGYILKISTEGLNVKMDDTGEFILAQGDVPLGNVIEVNGQQFNPENSRALLNQDIEQALTQDVGQEITDRGEQSTSPVDSRFDMDTDEAVGAIRGMFNDAEIDFVTMGSKDIVTPDGKLARGRYYDSIISVVEEGGKVESRTVYHEAFHAYADKFVQGDIYQAAIDETLAENQSLTEQQAVEELAEGFADYMGGRRTGFGNAVQNFFDTLLYSVRKLMGKVSSAEMIYRNIVARDRSGTGTRAGAPEYSIERGPVTPEQYRQQPVQANIFLSQMREDPQEIGFDSIRNAAINGDMHGAASLTQQIFNIFDQAFFPEVSTGNVPVMGIYFGQTEGSNRIDTHNPKDTPVSLYKGLVMAKYNNQESVFVQDLSRTDHPNLRLELGQQITPEQQVQLASDIAELSDGKFAGGSFIPSENLVQISYIPDYADITPEQAVDLMGELVVKLQEKGYQFRPDITRSGNELIFNQNYDERIRQLASEDRRVARAMEEAGNPDFRGALEGAFRESGHILSYPNEFWAAATGGIRAQPQFRVEESPTNQDLAMEALRQRQGKYAPQPPKVIGEEVRPRSRQFITQLNRMAKDADAEIAAAQKALDNYGKLTSEQKRVLVERSQEVSPELQQEIADLARIKSSLYGELYQIEQFLANYDLRKQYDKNIMERQDFEALSEQLRGDIAAIDQQIAQLKPRPIQTTGKRGDNVMTKKDLRQHIRDMKEDLKSLQATIKEAEKDTRPKYEEEAPVPTNEELAMEALRRMRGDITPDEGPVPTDEELAMDALRRSRGEIEEEVESPVEAESAEEMAAAQPIQGTPQQPQGVQIQEEPPTPVGKKKKLRKLVQSADETGFAPEDVVEGLTEDERNWFGSISNEQTIAEAKQAIDQDYTKELQKVLQDDPVAIGYGRLYAAKVLELARRAREDGNNDLMQEILTKGARNATLAGQAVQAWAIMSRLTPEGMVRFAQKEIEKANEKFDWLDPRTWNKRDLKLHDDVRDAIIARMEQIQEMEDGPEKRKAVDAVMEMIAMEMPLTASEYIDAYRYQNMLSSVRTQLRNIRGNLWQLLITRPIEDTVTAGLDIIGSTLTGKPRKEYFDLPTHTRAGIAAMPLAVQEAWERMKGTTTIEQPDIQALKSIRQVRLTPRYLTVVSRMLEAGDVFFQTIIKAGESAALQNRGWSKEDADAKAQEVASKYLFRNEVDPNNETGQGRLLSKVDQMTQGIYKIRRGPIAWFIPIIKTPMNIAKMQLEYSPLGVFTLPGNTNKTRQMAKVSIGTMITMTGAAMAAAGRTTWEAPKDDEEKKLFYDSGKKPYAVLLPTPQGDKWIPMQALGVYGLAFAIPAAMHHFQADNEDALTDDQVKKILNTTRGIVKFYTGMTYFEGLDAFVKTMTGDNDYTSGGSLAFTLGQFLPLNGLVNYVTTIVDPVYRKASGFKQGIQKSWPTIRDPQGNVILPGSDLLPAHTTSTGQEATRLRDAQDNLIPVSSAYTSYTMGTPNAEFDRLQQERKNLIQTRRKVSSIEKKLDKQTATALDTLGNTSGSDETKLKELKTQTKSLIKTYLSTDDPTLHTEIESTLAMMGLSFDEAMDLYAREEIEPAPKGLSPAAAKKLERSNEYGYVRKIIEDFGDLPHAEKYIEDIMDKYDISMEEMIYDNKTALPDDVQLDQVKAELDGLEGEDRLAAMVAMRVVSEGTRKPLLTDTLLNKLEKEGYISEATADALKALEWDSTSGSFKKAAGGGSGGSKKVPKLNVSAPKVRSVPLTLPSTQGRIKLSEGISPQRQKVSLKLPEVNPLLPSSGSQYKPAQIKLNLRQPVTSIGGLGRI